MLLLERLTTAAIDWKFRNLPCARPSRFHTRTPTPLLPLLLPLLWNKCGKLGEGGFGVVYKATGVSDGQSYVLKRCKDYGEAELWTTSRLQRACPGATAPQDHAGRAAVPPHVFHGHGGGQAPVLHPGDHHGRRGEGVPSSRGGARPDLD